MFFMFGIILSHGINSLMVSLLSLDAKILIWKLISGHVWLQSHKSWLIFYFRTSFLDVAKSKVVFFLRVMSMSIFIKLSTYSVPDI